ncbi:MAG: adenosylcobalamin-dependent ribonucleoside-diphosphate reductase, partial [Massilia sp.]|nr:adenosylcobalamin-dependent ribonucleoside-diphosphate reductase [Massilia sp.]
DMRDVVWEKGPVRCGFLVRDDGVRVPVFHDSEAAAVGFMLQRILINRGFLDAQGNGVPVPELANKLARLLAARAAAPQAVAPIDSAILQVTQATAGAAKCPECGARALRKAEGCTRCDNCEYVGECG